MCQDGCRFYFAYCEAGFDARYLHNFQVTWTKTEDTRQAEQYRPRAEQQPAEDTRRMDPSLQVRSPEIVGHDLHGALIDSILGKPSGNKQRLSACCTGKLVACMIVTFQCWP